MTNNSDAMIFIIFMFTIMIILFSIIYKLTYKETVNGSSRRRQIRGQIPRAVLHR